MPGRTADVSPNMIVIMLDDLSVDAFRVLLEGGWLPEIQDHLINDGVKFDNAFVTNAECCPSRATFLTGRYSHNHLVIANHTQDPFKAGIAWDGWFPSEGDPGHEASTIATWLQDGGYRTGFIGKYLNGYGEQAPEGVDDPKSYVPPGWSSWNGLLSPSLFEVFNYELNENGAVIQYGEDEEDYQTDVIASRAANFVGGSQPEPFFLWIAPLAPHIEVPIPSAPLTGNDPLGGLKLNIRPAPRHEHLVDGDPENGEIPSLEMKPSFNEADLSDKPSCPRDTPPVEVSYVKDPACLGDRPSLDTEQNILDLDYQYRTMLASMIAVDDMVGALVERLTTDGKWDNTVLMLTSDNGWFFGEHRIIGKELAYEESIRVPLVVRLPGGIAGATSSEIVLNNDLAPTLADLGGITPPYDPDGTTLLPLVQSNPTSTWQTRKRFLVERWFIPSLLKYDGPTYLALRSIANGANFTYIATRADPLSFNTVTHHELYDLNTDPHQEQSITLPDSITTSLDNFLNLFLTCDNTVCRVLETF